MGKFPPRAARSIAWAGWRTRSSSPNLALPLASFAPELLEQLRGASAVGDPDRRRATLIVRHCYVERRHDAAQPLPRDRRRREQLEHAVREYGDAIRELAIANVFPGDHASGATSASRATAASLFYDYDEVEYLTDCVFRAIPQAPNPEAELVGRRLVRGRSARRLPGGVRAVPARRAQRARGVPARTTPTCSRPSSGRSRSGASPAARWWTSSRIPEDVRFCRRYAGTRICISLIFRCASGNLNARQVASLLDTSNESGGTPCANRLRSLGLAAACLAGRPCRRRRTCRLRSDAPARRNAVDARPAASGWLDSRSSRPQIVAAGPTRRRRAAAGGRSSRTASARRRRTPGTDGVSVNAVTAGHMHGVARRMHDELHLHRRHVELHWHRRTLRRQREDGDRAGRDTHRSDGHGPRDARRDRHDRFELEQRIGKDFALVKIDPAFRVVPGVAGALGPTGTFCGDPVGQPVMHYGHGYIFFVEQGDPKFGEVIPDLTSSSRSHRLTASTGSATACPATPAARS